MRRHLLVTLAAAAFAAAWPWAKTGAAETAPVIGLLSPAPEPAGKNLAVAFLDGLRDLGYVDGRNIAIEYRWADGHVDRLPALAADLVARKVALIVAFAPPAIRAAMAATSTIPIVMRSSVDPVEAGFVRSLAQPGGNVTGVTSYSGSLYGKRLELLKELLPGVGCVAVLTNPASDTHGAYANEARIAARALGLEAVFVEARNPAELPAAFAAARRAGCGAIVPLRDPLVVINRKRIAELAVEYRLPAIYDDREFIDAGGLVSYGADLRTVHRRAAYYVDRILRGARPAELPVEQPARFEMVVNLPAARQIGLAVPRSILLIADQVIE